MGQLLENTLLGGVMILTAALLRRLLRRLSPNAALLLWALCLARLLTPAPLTGPVSLYGTAVREARDSAYVPGASAPASPLPDLPVEAEAGTREDLPAGPSGHAGRGPAILLIYRTGASVLAALAVRAWFRSRRRVRAVPLASERPEGVLPERARLRVGRVPGAPLTFGVARPDVVLTPELRGEEYAYVLAHEAAHARRGDNLWHYLAALTVCVHWFNPAVWLMAALIRRDVELSCDRAVLAGASGDIRERYARAVIRLSEAQKGAAFASGFARRKTEERIVSIMKYKKTTAAGIAAAVLAAGVVAALALTPARAAAPEETEFTFTAERTPGKFFMDSGEIRCHITKAWAATEESQIPEGRFKPYCNADPTLLTADGSGGNVALWTQGGTPAFIREDGSFRDGMYLIFLEAEVTNDGASAVTLYEENANGNLTDPYMFDGDEMIELADNGKDTGIMNRTYRPEFFSFYGECFDVEAMGGEWDYNYADACLAFRLEPGETRTVTLGYFVTPGPDGTLPEPSRFRAQPCTCRGGGDWYEGPMAYLNLK